jgi:hypothetical protein
MEVEILLQPHDLLGDPRGVALLSDSRSPTGLEQRLIEHFPKSAPTQSVLNGADDRVMQRAPKGD